MNAKKYLKQLKKLDKMIENKMYEKDHMMSIATRTTSFLGGERVKSSGSHQKMADAVNRFIDLENEIERFIDELVDTRKEIIKVIEQLDSVEYDILHKIYVQYMDFEDVAIVYGKSYSWATHIHGRALKHVQHILDERDKNERSK